MAQKRLSSLFVVSKSQSTSNLSQSTSNLSQSSSGSHTHDRDSSQERTSRLQQQKVHRLRVTSDGSNPPPAAFFQDIEPPQFPSQRSASNPPSSNGSRPGSRAGSPINSREGSRSRPQTPALLAPGAVAQSPSPGTPSSATLKKRRSWMPGTGGKSDKAYTEQTLHEPKAWIAGLREHIPYDIVPLLNGTRLADLWNEDGDVLIYLFPKSAGKGPSIKLNSALFDASAPLQQLLFASSTEQVALNPHILNSGLVSEEQQFHIQSPGGSSLYSSTQNFPPTDAFARMGMDRNGPGTFGVERHVYVPLTFDDVGLAHPGGQAKGDDLELLVLYRNFFAFLLGGALISTPRQVSLFTIFLGISSVLNRFEFTNADGSTFGDVAAHSFTRYQDELRLADVRASREKTIEAIVLGEKMKSWALYNEGFAHAVGKLEDMKNIHSPKYDMISQETQRRMERALHDLQKRVMTVKLKIDDFDFPSMFSGIANSVTEKESKLVRFKAWKASFMAFRKHTLDHYKHKYGAWPPKAHSKKHNFEGSGLNRVLLLELYHDFTDLYDMLADRSNLTSRSVDLYSLGEDAETNDINESLQHAMRRVESEYDRSGVPVLPPIPFDVPLVPSFSGSFNRQHVMIPNNSATSTKRLKDNEVNEVLLGSYNRQSMKATPWLQDFLSYERRAGHGKTMDEIVDMRCGQWLFMYAILQSLPNLVVDARELRFCENVEYFLCIAPRGGRPWMKDDSGQSRSWYNVASGGGLVSLPSDVIDHSVEGIYRRSHCWVVATQWAQDIGAISLAEAQEAYLPPPPAYANDSPRISPRISPYLTPNSRPGSPAASDSGRLSRNGDRNSVNLGLQAVAPPEGRRSRPVSTYNPHTTFDTILGTGRIDSPGKRKGKK